MFIVVAVERQAKPCSYLLRDSCHNKEEEDSVGWPMLSEMENYKKN